MRFKKRSIKTETKAQIKTKKFSFVKFIVLGALISVGIFLVFSIYVLAQVSNIVDSRHTFLTQDESTDEVDREKCGILGCVSDMLFNRGCVIRESKGRTNIMLLGAGGSSHIQGGENLTDTIIVMSIFHETNSVSMISIPRDLWVRPPGYKPVKINTLYEMSQRYYEEGFTIPKATIEDLFGLPIHYYAYVDFIAFEKIIDALGGIEVNVEKAFKDVQYPDGNFGYITIAFEAGKQVLDGKSALQFARSRHGSNGENSDFARAHRQHNIIQAVKDKVLSFGTLFKLDDIKDAIKLHYLSNLKPCEIYRFLLMAKDISRDKVHSLVLDDGPSGLLYTPTEEIREASYGGQYVLIPDGNNYRIIKKYVEKFLKNPDQFSRGPSISVLNGSGKEGLANVVGAELAAEGFRVILRDNTSGRKAYNNTVIYTTTPGEYYQSLLYLEKYSGGLPTGANPEPVVYGSDIVLILGKDFAEARGSEEGSVN